ncbi:MAG: hypothetical protein R3Y24_08195 [Eubacteriales bacterium]
MSASVISPLQASEIARLKDENKFTSSASVISPLQASEIARLNYD